MCLCDVKSCRRNEHHRHEEGHRVDQAHEALGGAGAREHGLCQLRSTARGRARVRLARQAGQHHRGRRLDRGRPRQAPHAQGHPAATQHLHVHEGHRRVARHTRMPGRHTVHHCPTFHCRRLGTFTHIQGDFWYYDGVKPL